jgi:arsenate reductase
VRVLFVCVQNAGRSQIAEALFRRATNGRHEARSAGTEPAERVHPEVAEALAESGIDVADRKPRRLGREDAEWADVVVTMGCGDACPVIPGKSYVDWQIEDPAGKGLETARRVRDEIALRVLDLAEQLDLDYAGKVQRT